MPLATSTEISAIDDSIAATASMDTFAAESAAALVERAQRGDQAAFERIATAAFPRLWDIARRLLRDQNAAEDAVQDCLLRAWRDLRALRDPARFDAWLYRLLARSCADEWRRSKRRVMQVEVSSLETRGDAAPDLDLERRDMLERAFVRLNADQRLVLVLHYYVGLRPGEIADQLGVPEGTVTSRLHYGVRALRGAVDADLRLPGQDLAR